MRRHLFLPLSMVAIIGSLQPPGFAGAIPAHDLGRSRSGTITVYDPQELEECPPIYNQDCEEDIRFASLRIYAGGTGRRMLAVTVEAYELHGGLVEVANIKLRFDSRGGPHPDWYVLMAIANLAYDIGWACGQSFGTERYRLEEHGDSLTCFIPERDLHPTKPIRFQAFSRVNASVADRAPDQGWAG